MRKFLPALLALCLLLPGCARRPAEASGFLLNTFVSIRIYEGGDESLAREALELCRDYEAIFSRTDPGSELYRLNHREICQVSDELARGIALGLEFGRRTGGAFDITMGGVSQLWDFTASEPSLPDPGEVREQLAGAGWEGVTLEGNTVTFSHPDTVIDLGGIAKGYIADQLAQFLRERGVTSAILNLGGNILCLGNKPGGSSFQVGIQYPYRERQEVIGSLPVRDGSVVTSGIYERGFTLDGTVYHHILDPHTGWPVENDLVAVSILSNVSAQADALSTACFVLGLEEGMALIEETEGTEAVFITDDLQLHLSSGLEDIFQPAAG